MAEYKAVVNDKKTGKSYNVTVTGHHANSLTGKCVGEIIDGIFVGLPGYKLQITGGSDGNGTPMRKDLPGNKRRMLLMSEGLGFHEKYPGQRRSRREKFVERKGTSLRLRYNRFDGRYIFA